MCDTDIGQKRKILIVEMGEIVDEGADEPVSAAILVRARRSESSLSLGNIHIRIVVGKFLRKHVFLCPKSFEQSNLK